MSLEGGSLSETVARRDAGLEPTWMYSRRVSERLPPSRLVIVKLGDLRQP